MNNFSALRDIFTHTMPAAQNVKSIQYGVESFYRNGKPSKKIIRPERVEAPSFEKYGMGEPFRHLRRMLNEENSNQIISCLEASGLTGCGGAHFPVATKWKAALENTGPRYLVVNGLEGEPYTFKDYYLMNNYASILLEGALLAALAVKAKEALIVINSAYKQCLEKVGQAVIELKKLVEFLPVKITVIAGPDPDLYICGEESALIQFLEGKRGEPQLRPPFPFQQGYQGCPTIIQNAETISWIPLLMDNPDLFQQQGNIKLVNIWGDVRQSGIYEVTIGTSLAALLEKAGGLTEGSRLLAMEVGGLAGGLLPPQLIDLPLEHKAIREAGGMVGTGSVRFLNQKNDLIAEVKNAMTFFQDECCGRCTPCRVGTQQLVKITEYLDKETVNADADIREYSMDMAQLMMDTSICGLGKGAPMQLLSLLRYWGNHD